MSRYVFYFFVLGVFVIGGCDNRSPVTPGSEMGMGNDGGSPADQALHDIPGAEDGGTPPDGGAPVEPLTHYFPANLKKKVDLLVVLDNSNTMALEQENLRKNFSAIINELSLMSGGMPDIHIGIISTDLGAGTTLVSSCNVVGGDGAKLHHTPKVSGCQAPSDPYIAYADGKSNVPGIDAELAKVEAAFTCIAALGTGGCGFEHQLESTRRALDPTLKVNPGFLRDEALLAVLIITDEDDCSAENEKLFDPGQQGLNDPLGPLNSFRCFEFGITCDVNGREIGERHHCQPGFDFLYTIDDYRSFYQGLKPQGQVVMAAIAGPVIDPVTIVPEGSAVSVKASCSSSNQGTGMPAIRIKAMTEVFGPAGQFNAQSTTICSGDYTPALKAFATRIAAQLGLSCLAPLKDTDSSATGIQASCQIADLVGKTKTSIPQCTSASGSCTPCPCWRVVPQAACAPVGDGYALEVARDQPAASGTIVEAQCQMP